MVSVWASLPSLPHLPPQMPERRASTAPPQPPRLTAMPLPSPLIPLGIVPFIPVYGSSIKKLRPPGPSTLPSPQSPVFALGSLGLFYWTFSFLLYSRQNLGPRGRCLFCSPVQPGPLGSGGERIMRFTPHRYFQTFSLSSLTPSAWKLISSDSTYHYSS